MILVVIAFFATTTFSSLDAFITKFSNRTSKNILIYTKDYQKDNNIEFFPIYMAQFL